MDHTSAHSAATLSPTREATVAYNHDDDAIKAKEEEKVLKHVHDAHVHDIFVQEAAPPAAVEVADDHGHSHETSCEAQVMENYNLSFRIGSLFIIMGTSAIGVFAPILIYRISPYKEGGLRDWTLTAGKFFGTGVIIATAFIHMLPEGLEKFDSECIGEGWHSYHAFGGLFCLISSFLLQLVELAALSKLDSLAQKNDDAMVEKGLVPMPTHTHKHPVPYEHCHHGIHEEGHVHSAGFLESDQSMRNIGTFILELGILMHSIIIGITLGTEDEESVMTLLIALVFHQFFEGIALGSRINDLHCKCWKKPVLMGLLFIIMTPIGIAIGIGIRNTLNPGSSILAQGILDSLSAGILLYNAYVSLMSIEINHNVGFRKSPWFRKLFCFLFMYCGAALMAVLGTWA
ncbi:ZIP zinc transporter-domain-containing protein [Mycotypha africana]|uniref:ZIP zinc transporter-domain-containing protein n=1 Tax=Mycotypha africana TaxID=64632 RepID=UPI002301C811|nr:ZIP zinc transporter-domain-containing protein [Mycotypha africana]KAI8977114.1 ZIP zinc transporter-domain-containing protein [Mycotypha africana]